MTDVMIYAVQTTIVLDYMTALTNCFLENGMTKKIPVSGSQSKLSW